MSQPVSLHDEKNEILPSESAVTDVGLRATNTESCTHHHPVAADAAVVVAAAAATNPPSTTAAPLYDPRFGTSNAWLLRLFKSEYFNEWLAVYYLHKSGDNEGVQDYLCEELARYSIETILELLPQICHILVTNPKMHHLEAFVSERCHRSPHFAVQTAWYLQCYLADVIDYPNSMAYILCFRMLLGLQKISTGESSKKPAIDSDGAIVPGSSVGNGCGISNVQLESANCGILQKQSLLYNAQTDQTQYDTPLAPPTPISFSNGSWQTSTPSDRTPTRKNIVAQAKNTSTALLLNSPSARPSLEDLHRGKAFSFSQFLKRVVIGGTSTSSASSSSSTSTTSLPSINSHTVGSPGTIGTTLPHVITTEIATAAAAATTTSQDTQRGLLNRRRNTSLAQLDSESKTSSLLRPNYSALIEADPSLMEKYHFHSEMQFLASLASIADRLLALPREARPSSLLAEISLLNHNFPAAVCIPLWCSSTAGPTCQHHVVRICTSDAVVLDSAERVPYLILIEVIMHDNDNDKIGDRFSGTNNNNNNADCGSVPSLTCTTIDSGLNSKSKGGGELKSKTGNICSDLQSPGILLASQCDDGSCEIPTGTVDVSGANSKISKSGSSLMTTSGTSSPGVGGGIYRRPSFLLHSPHGEGCNLTDYESTVYTLSETPSTSSLMPSSRAGKGQFKSPGMFELPPSEKVFVERMRTAAVMLAQLALQEAQQQEAATAASMLGAGKNSKKKKTPITRPAEQIRGRIIKEMQALEGSRLKSLKAQMEVAEQEDEVGANEVEINGQRCRAVSGGTGHEDGEAEPGSSNIGANLNFSRAVRTAAAGGGGSCGVVAATSGGSFLGRKIEQKNAAVGNGERKFGGLDGDDNSCAQEGNLEQDLGNSSGSLPWNGNGGRDGDSDEDNSTRLQPSYLVSGRDNQNQKMSADDPQNSRAKKRSHALPTTSCLNDETAHVNSQSSSLSASMASLGNVSGSINNNHNNNNNNNNTATSTATATATNTSIPITAHSKKFETWEKKVERIRAASPYGREASWNLMSVIIKSDADLRQEQFAYQLVRLLRRIWAEAAVDCWVYPYKVMVTGPSNGLIETVRNTVSLHSLKKEGTTKRKIQFTLRDYFVRLFGPVGSERFAVAQANFAASLAGYSLLTYVLNVKDRHNGNILLDYTTGHLVHIDFGFMLSNSPGRVGFETAPFKFPYEYLDLLDGYGSAVFLEWRGLVVSGLLALRREHERFIGLIEVMERNSPMSCFAHSSIPVDDASAPPTNAAPQNGSVNASSSSSFSSGAPMTSSDGFSASTAGSAAYSSAVAAAASVGISASLPVRPSTPNLAPSEATASGPNTTAVQVQCPAAAALRDRLQLGLSDSQVGEYVDKMIASSLGNVFTRLYDSFQYYTQGVMA